MEIVAVSSSVEEDTNTTLLKEKKKVGWFKIISETMVCKGL